MFSENTLGYEVGDKYLNSCYFHNPEKFRSLLCDDVEMVHITNGKVYRENGIDNVYRIYKKMLFDTTKSVDIEHSYVTSNKFMPELECSVIDKKKEADGTEYFARYVDKTILTLEYVDKDLKIRKIDTVVTKTILE